MTSIVSGPSSHARRRERAIHDLPPAGCRPAADGSTRSACGLACAPPASGGGVARRLPHNIAAPVRAAVSSAGEEIASVLPSTHGVVPVTQTRPPADRTTATYSGGPNWRRRRQAHRAPAAAITATTI